MSNIEKREEIANLLEKFGPLLTQTQRQALMLYYFEDLSLAEIADIVATTRSAVFDAIKKGEKKLIDISERLQ